MAKRSICSVSECGNKSYVSGLCSMHYTRLRRHGDVGGAGREKASPGSLLAWLHGHISVKGDACVEWPFGTSADGYGEFQSSGKRTLAHRFMCEAAHGPPPSSELEAAHSCGIRRCVNPNHLRWATRKENQSDRILHGTDGRGERASRAKLTEQDVLRIRSMANLKDADIARAFKISPSHVCALQRGRFWPHINPST